MCGYIMLLYFAGRINYLNQSSPVKSTKRTWKIKSVDTMKYSRDLALEQLHNPAFDENIEDQVKAIVATGANYIAIGTPYDEQFFPYLKRWVSISRKYRLNIWLRGNFSGWQGWFNYKIINDPNEHVRLIREFIANHPTLFEEGDIFDPCTECENGSYGDPRDTQLISEYRQFLINERNTAIAEFQKIGINVTVLTSMNFDVARLIMDKETAKAMGSIVTIDHYVKQPQKLHDDIANLAKQSEAKIILGEFGAPIPDIHGRFTEAEQADWINNVLTLISRQKDLIGLNYWVAAGGTTSILNQKNSQRFGAFILEKFYKLESLPD